jgi:predicted ribosome quality control (RQC) complex YloA/Tae2 family protein
MASKGRPYRTLLLDGYQILIGRGEHENDELTFEVAAPQDLWLHVAGGTPGSHVVIRNPTGGAVPAAVQQRAAAAAAWFSRARRAAEVKVHVCRVSDVSKPHDAPAGLVELARFNTIKVKPADPAGDGTSNSDPAL